VTSISDEVAKQLKYFVYICIFCHWFACLFYGLARITKGENTWLHKFDYIGKSNTEIYIASYYFVI
jgi:hypothetical protein